MLIIQFSLFHKITMSKKDTIKVDITPSAVEKGLELAKDFLEKLIVPTVEETGLLLKDQIASWRFKNQVKILNKARAYCEKHNISPKQVSFKLICPLLEFVSLEEDEKLQDKWSVLISNLVDSDQNIENHVFPYILSQISVNEYEALERSFRSMKERQAKHQEELRIFKEESHQKEESLKENIEIHKDDFMQRYQFESQLRELASTEKRIQHLINEPQVLDDSALKDFEVSNLIRLGLVKNVIQHYANVEPIQLPSSYEMHDSLRVELDIGIDQDYEYQNLTELGELFISACTEKNVL